MVYSNPPSKKWLGDQFLGDNKFPRNVRVSSPNRMTKICCRLHIDETLKGSHGERVRERGEWEGIERKI